MVLAHLLEEARHVGAQHAAAGGPAAASHAGLALLSFLRRFSGQGEAFVYSRDAVSVRLGGCVSQMQLPYGFARPDCFLVLEDPLTGALGLGSGWMGWVVAP